MNIRTSSDQATWDAFLGTKQYRPFLQSWTMGEVYREIGEEPLRLEIRDGAAIIGICQALVVDARRGKHLSVPYGPIIDERRAQSAELPALIDILKEEAKKRGCSFIRISPFVREEGQNMIPRSLPSPLHLLAEHLWYIPLSDPDPWNVLNERENKQIPEQTLLMSMRNTTRNLIRRAEKEGVTIHASDDPIRDLPAFIRLHEETRKRHGFTPYTNDFFRAQVKHFAQRNECTLYTAIYRNEVIAASIHIHAFGETSYHHGASTQRFGKIPASYLLQWVAIRDALRRGDRIYNFWGIASAPNHPFAGVTTFKTGFGGRELHLIGCKDVPLRSTYYVTRAFELLRKWKRGF